MCTNFDLSSLRNTRARLRISKRCILDSKASASHRGLVEANS
jgi:hypothetical protein